MVSFSCENCGDVLTKKKLDPHRNQCRGASFTCLDCMVHFRGTDYRSHTSCITEAQKYQGALYKEKKSKQQSKPLPNESRALTPRNAYVEDAPDVDTGAVAIVDVPPPAPSPPPAAASIEAAQVNVFDFLIGDATPDLSKTAPPLPDETRMIEDNHEQQLPPQAPTPLEHAYNGGYDPRYHYAENGFHYGAAPVQPTFERYDSYPNLAVPPPEYTASEYFTPAPRRDMERNKVKGNDSTAKVSDKKRKRQQLDELDMSRLQALPQDRDDLMTDAPAVLHSGLTGGLNRLLSRPDFPPSPDYSGGDRGHASPLSPIKRKKHSSNEKERGREREPKPRKASDSTQHTEATRRTMNGHARKSRRDRDRDDSDRESRRHRHRRRQRHTESISPTRRPSPSRATANDTHGAKPAPKSIGYARPASVQPTNGNAMIVHKPTTTSTDLASPTPSSRAELFLSFVTKGPASERGCSLNKALKRYHRERYDRREDFLSRAEEEKELWKGLRLRRNERGEVVVFV